MHAYAEVGGRHVTLKMQRQTVVFKRLVRVHFELSVAVTNLPKIIVFPTPFIDILLVAIRT